MLSLHAYGRRRYLRHQCSGFDDSMLDVSKDVLLFGHRIELWGRLPYGLNYESMRVAPSFCRIYREMASIGPVEDELPPERNEQYRQRL